MRQAKQDWRNHHRVKAATGLIKREWPVVGWAISFFALAWVILQVATFSDDLRDGLVDACEKNGNPLRKYLADQARDQIAQTKSLDYERFFPNIPPEELNALLRAQNQKRREALRTTLAPIDCDELYPK